MSDEGQDRRLVRLLGAPLVAITGRFQFLDKDGEPDGKDNIFAATAFAMTFDGTPILVTAGHVIEDELDSFLVKHEYKGFKLKVFQTNICDFFGPNAKVPQPTPFSEYSNTPRCSIDQALQRNSWGLDFGVLILRPYYWTGILANGVTPLNESFWAEEGEHFDAYRMIGFPAQPRLQENGEIQTVSYNVIRSIDPTAKGPDGKPNWFVGQLPPGFTDVKGISGGPIFGFRKRADGEWDYRVVAMQSWQGAGNGIVYGTPIQSFAPRVVALLAELRRRADQKSRDSGKSLA